MVVVSIDVQVACDSAGVPLIDDIHDWVEAAVVAAGAHKTGPVEIAVRIVDAGEMQLLNGRYRQQDKPTNVLSFAADDSAYLEYVHLGDLVICAPVVEREAREPVDGFIHPTKKGWIITMTEHLIW